MHLYKTKIQITLTGNVWVAGDTEVEADAKIVEAPVEQVQGLFGQMIEIESIDGVTVLDHDLDDPDSPGRTT
jgi:hypothetical protein